MTKTEAKIKRLEDRVERLRYALMDLADVIKSNEETFRRTEPGTKAVTQAAAANSVLLEKWL